MKSFRSRPAIAVAAAAVLSMSASPAMARDWYRHHHRDRVDAGDVLAGILIIGGIAAIASAASKSDREKRERERDSDYRYPNGDYRDNRDYDAQSRRYGDAPRRDSHPGNWRGGSMDGAAEICVNEVERSDRRVDTVESVSREDFGWRVDGRLAGSGDYSCVVDRDGRIRRVTVDGRALI